MRSAVVGLVCLGITGCTTLGYRSSSPLSEECARAGRGADRHALQEAACMVATGEPTFVLAPHSPLAPMRMSFTVQATTAKGSETALGDLLACERPMNAVQAQAIDDGAPRRRSAMREWKVERAFAECMGPRGYTVHRWQSTRQN